jgi:hypothetical protein
VHADSLPTLNITAEAWVYLSHNIRWGGIVGYIQDNGVCGLAPVVTAESNVLSSVDV